MDGWMDGWREGGREGEFVCVRERECVRERRLEEAGGESGRHVGNNGVAALKPYADAC